MAFRVEISPRALHDLDEIAQFIKRREVFELAGEWFNGIISAIRTLEAMPSRCRVAEESEVLGMEVRVLLYGKSNHKYKVYFAIYPKTGKKGTVRVFHVRHWARQSLSADRLQELMDDSDARRI